MTRVIDIDVPADDRTATYDLATILNLMDMDGRGDEVVVTFTYDPTDDTIVFTRHGYGDKA